MSEEKILNLKIPNEMPRMGNVCSRWFGRTIFSMLGWKLGGAFPRHKKIVLIGVPHTSNWDFILAMLAIMGLGMKVSYLMKKEAFFWPLGSFFKWLGGIPIDRSKHSNTVEQITTWFDSQEKGWVGITPEGTRDKVKEYKTGFIRIAREANVPVGFVCWDYPSKTIYIETCWPLVEDDEIEAKKIQQYLTAKYQGRHPQKQ